MATLSSRWLADILGHTVAVAPQSTALLSGPDRTAIGYGQLDRAVDDVGTALARHGLGPRDVVALQTANTAEFVVALLGAARAGVVVAPLDPELPDVETRRRLDMLGARVTLVGPGAPLGGGYPRWQLSGSRLDAGAPPRDGRAPVGLGDDDALIMLTSGTTGTPKMVPWTHRSLQASVTAITRTYGLAAADATVAAMPLFHGHGLVAALLATLASGGTVLLPAAGRFTAHTFWDDMAAAGATWYTAVPTIHRILLARAAPGQPDERRDHGRLRFVRSCSAPMPATTIEALEATFGVPLLAAYGMTEATHQVSSVTPDDDAVTRHHTVGKPAVATVRIDDTGEIRLTGPTVARGYLGHAGGAGTFEDGWLHSGDLGALDAHGNLTVTGRIKNLINRGGEKISPEHVEQVIGGCPGVGAVAVAGVPDPLYGEAVAAVVVPAAGAEPTAESIVDSCRNLLAHYEVPQRIMLAPQLPLTAKGDVDRAALAVLLAADQVSPAGRV